jgi:hypothetical protein
MRRPRGPLLAVLLVLLVVLAGFGYYYYVTSSALSANSQSISFLQSQVQSIQALDAAKASVKISAWLSTSTDTVSSFQVKITNGNGFDVTVKQVTINAVDGFGNQIGSNTVAPQITVSAGTSVTTSVDVSTPPGAAGAAVSAIITTPYGQVVVGTL